MMKPAPKLPPRSPLDKIDPNTDVRLLRQLQRETYPPLEQLEEELIRTEGLRDEKPL